MNDDRLDQQVGGRYRYRFTRFVGVVIVVGVVGDRRALLPGRRALTVVDVIIAAGAISRLEQASEIDPGNDTYAQALDATYDYERRRLSKMIAEGQWMRGFRSDLGRCLEGEKKVR